MEYRTLVWDEETLAMEYRTLVWDEGTLARELSRGATSRATVPNGIQTHRFRTKLMLMSIETQLCTRREYKTFRPRRPSSLRPPFCTLYVYTAVLQCSTTFVLHRVYSSSCSTGLMDSVRSLPFPNSMRVLLPHMVCEALVTWAMYFLAWLMSKHKINLIRDV